MNGKFYRGMHSTDVWEDGYLGSGRWLQNSVRKYGRENFRREILEDCSKEGRSHLREREKVWVNEELLKDPLCMNLIEGGNATAQGRSTTVREKISLALKGRKLSDEHRKKMSEQRAGKKRSENVKKSIKAAWDQKKLDVDAYKKFCESVSRATIGKPKSDDHKKKLVVVALGRRHTEETKAKMSLSHLKNKGMTGA